VRCFLRPDSSGSGLAAGMRWCRGGAEQVLGAICGIFLKKGGWQAVQKPRKCKLFSYIDAIWPDLSKVVPAELDFFRYVVQNPQ